MSGTRILRGAATVACAVVVSLTWVNAQQRRDAVAIDRDDIGGVVSSVKGPEAGVWVIAETVDLPTKFAKIVVTDDRGRYVLPDLPSATYKVWVRGYGLVDSAPVQGRPGSQINLEATVARSAKAAAQYFPPDSWYSLLHVPGPENFPGTGPSGNGIPDTFKTQRDWVTAAKACLNCHQIGNNATRELPEAPVSYTHLTLPTNREV